MAIISRATSLQGAVEGVVEKVLELITSSMDKVSVYILTTRDNTNVAV